MRRAASLAGFRRTPGVSLMRTTAQACVEARRALQLARRGERQGGRQLVDQLRSEFQGREFTELSIRLSVAEGILSMPVVGGAAAPWAARDRFARAWTLGRHHADAGLAALASAWSAHGLLAAGHWKLFAESAVTGLRRARPQDHEALSRWALSLGGACLLANDTDWAQIWFERARRQACAEHDGAALADTLCDLAWHQTQRLQLLRATHPEEQPSRSMGQAIDQAQASLQTARAYVLLNTAGKVSARFSNLQCVQAVICNLQGLFERELSSWNEALAAYHAWCGSITPGGLPVPEEAVFAQTVAVQQWCARLAQSRAQSDVRHPPELDRLEQLGADTSVVERLKLWDSVWRVISCFPAAHRRWLPAGYHSGVAKRRQEALDMWLGQQRELRTCLQGGDLDPLVWTSWYEP